MALYYGIEMGGRSLGVDDTPGDDDYSVRPDEALMRQIWDAVPGTPAQKLDGVAGAGFAPEEVMGWATKNNLLTPGDAQGAGFVQRLADRGYTMTADGQFNDPVRGGFSWGGNELGLWPVALGVGGFAAAAAAGTGAATGAGEAALAGGGEVGSGYAASAPGALGGAGTGASAAPLADAGMDMGMFSEAANPYVTGASSPAAAQAVNSAAAAGGGVGTTAGGTTAAVAGGTALSRLLSGNGSASAADVASILGTLGATGLGVYGAGQQADAYRDIANQGRADRAPYLTKSLEYLNNPEAYISGPGQSSMDATLRALSARGGNPIDQPTSLAIATQAGMRDWRDAYTGLANIGLSGEDSRNQVLSNAVRAEGGQYDALGYGLGELTRPRRPSLGDYLASLA